MATRKTKPGPEGSGGTTAGALTQGITRQRVSTIFDNLPPMTEEEAARARAVQRVPLTERRLIALLVEARDNRAWAKRLCALVIDFVAEDDELAAMMRTRLRVSRSGKQRGQRRAWTWVRYFLLVLHYYGYRQDGDSRDEALEKVASFLGTTRREIDKRRLAEANRVISPEDIAEIPNSAALVEFVRAQRAKRSPDKSQ